MAGGPTTGTDLSNEEPPVLMDYRYSVNDGKATIVAYVGSGGEVVIPETLNGYPVESIGPRAFSYNKNVTAVIIPGSFSSTGYLSFYGCENLRTLTVCEGVTQIDVGSFAECKALREVSLPDSLVTIEASAFKGCTALTAIDLKNVKHLRNAAFCTTGLTSVTVPASVEETGEMLFAQCESLTSAVWLTGKFLNDMTFAFCYNLASIDLSGHPNRIYDSCFRRCYALTEITLPQSVDRVYEDAFMGCTSLKAVTIENPEISRLYEQSFHWLPALTDVYFAGSEEQWNAINIEDYNEGLELATLHFGA